MKWYLICFSLALIAFSAAYLLYPFQVLNRLRNLMNRVAVRSLAPIPFALGVLLFLSTGSTRTPTLVVILGFLLCLKGVYYYFAPSDHVRATVDWWFNRASDQTHRLFALIAYSLGLTLFYQIG